MRKDLYTAGGVRLQKVLAQAGVASRRAAERLGFRFEGIFRQAVVYKGRNRDTAWFAMLDADWPQVKQRMQHWLSEGNFDEQGRQRVPLQEIK